MALTTDTQLKQLEWSYQGRPFVNISAIGTSNTNLDLSYNGQPFVITAETTGGAGIKEATAGLNSLFTQSVSSTVEKNTSATLSSQVSLTATISHIEGADLVAFSNASISASGQRIRFANSSQSNQVSVSADVERIQQGQATINSQVSLDATATIIEPMGQIVEASGSWSSSCSINAPFSVTKQLSSSISAQATQTTDNSVIKGYESSLTVSTSIDSTASRIIDSGSAMSAEFTQTVTISHIEGADLFAFTEAQLALQVDRIRDNNVQVSSAYTITADAERTRYISGSLDSISLVDIDNLRVRYSEAAVDAAFSLDVTLERILEGNANLEATATVTATVEAIQPSGISLELQTDLSVTVDKITDYEADLSAEFSQTAYGSRTRDIDIIAADFATFNATGEVIRELSADLTAQVDVSSTAERIQTADSNLIVSTSLSAELAQTKEFIAASECETNQTTNAAKLVETTLGIFSEFTPSLTVDLFKDYSSELDVVFDLTAQVEKSADSGLVELTVTTSIQATGQCTREFDSTQSVTATLTPQVTKTVSSNSNQSSAFELSATISHIEGADLFAFTEASLAAQVDRIRDNTSELTSSCAATASVKRTRYAQGNINTVSAISTVNRRIRYNSSAINSAASLTVSVGKIVKFDAHGYSLFTPSLTVKVTKNNFAVLNVVSTLNASIHKTVKGQSALTAQTTQSTTARVTKRLSSNLNAVSSIVIAGNRDKLMSANISAAFTVTKATAKTTKRPVANLQVVPNLSVLDITVYEKYWIDYVDSVNGYETFKGSRSVISNVYGEIFSLTFSDTIQAGNAISPYSDPVLTKYNSHGDIQWIKETQFQITTFTGATLASDSLGNVYGLINQYDAATYPVSYTDMILIKWSRDGVVQWTRKLSGSTYNSESARELKIDNSDNIYVVGQTTRSGLTGSYPSITKYTTSGAKSWGKDYLDLGNITSIDFFSNGDLSVLGSTRQVTQSDQELLWARITNTGSVVWIRAMQDLTDSYETSAKVGGTYNDITVDSNGNSYSLCSYLGSGKDYYRPLISKLDSSGNIVWQKLYDTESSAGGGIAVYGNNLYISINNGHVANLNLDGQILWVRRFDQLGTYPRLGDLVFTVNKELLISSDNWGVFKLSSRGNKPSTYDNGWTISDADLPISDLTSVTFVPTTSVVTSEIISSAVSYNVVENKTVYTKTYTDLTLIKFNAALTSAFTASPGGTKVVRAMSQMSMPSSMVTINQRNLKFTISAQSTAQLTLRPSRTRFPGLSNLSAVANVNAIALRKKKLAAQLNAVATVSPTARVIRKGSGNLQSTAALSLAVTERIKQFSGSFQALAFEVAATAKIGRGLIHCDVTSTLASTAKVIARTDINIYSNAELACDFIVTKVADSNLTVAAEQTTVPHKITGYAGVLTSTNTLNSTPIAKFKGRAALTSRFTQLTIPWYLYTDLVSITSRFSLNADATKIARASTHFDAFTSELTVNDKIRYFEAHLQAFNTQVTVGRIFTIDPFFLIKIESETRELYIIPETRLVAIDSETRNLVINQESRLLSINPETRVNIIKGHPA